MIVIYPMLVSSNVQSHVLPGIAKVLEKFTLTYKLGDIIKKARNSSNFRLSEDTILSEAKGDPLPEKSSEKTGIVKVDMPTFNTLSLEPTWIKVDTQKGTYMLGIKVVPFPVVSDANLISLITSDFYKNWFPSQLSKMSRSVVRGFYAVLRSTPILKKVTSSFLPPVVGDPKKDIVFARTLHGKNVFLVINSMDIGSDFFERTNKIKQLYKLGWTSFVITDDVNKRAFFCMREFNGMCSSVQYNFMYTTIGNEHGKVFNDLEDVKKSSSPFFKLSTSASKIVAEHYVVDKVNHFLSGK